MPPTYLCKIHDIKVGNPPLLHPCLHHHQKHTTGFIPCHIQAGSAGSLAPLMGKQHRKTQGWWWICLFNFKVGGVESDLFPYVRQIINPYKYGLLDSSDKIMWLPTHNTEIVHTIEVSCGVAMVIDGRGTLGCSFFIKGSCRLYDVLLITQLCHTYSCKSPPFHVMVSLSLGAMGWFPMVLPPLRWMCIPSCYRCLWNFCLILWCRILPCGYLLVGV